MVKREYDWERVGTLVHSGLYEALNEMGQQGWELVCIEQGIAYFKRPITEH